MVNFQIKLYKLLRYLVITPWYKKISRDNSFGWRKKKEKARASDTFFWTPTVHRARSETQRVFEGCAPAPRGTGSGRLNMRGHVSPRFIVIVGTTTVEVARWSDIKSLRLVNDI